MGVGTLALLGGLFVLLAAQSGAGAPAMAALLVVLGLATLGVALRMWRATRVSLHLTRAGLHSSDGQIIAPLAQIASVDRGMFAYKPSNGFLLRLREAAPMGWAPGVWWRLGRRVGVGGTLSGAQTKPMAEMIQALMAERDAG